MWLFCHVCSSVLTRKKIGWPLFLTVWHHTWCLPFAPILTRIVPLLYSFGTRGACLGVWLYFVCVCLVCICVCMHEMCVYCRCTYSYPIHQRWNYISILQISSCKYKVGPGWKMIKSLYFFLRLSEVRYRGERCLFARRVTRSWLIAASAHQFTKGNLFEERKTLVPEKICKISCQIWLFRCKED